jgi:hypothetical protein
MSLNLRPIFESCVRTFNANISDQRFNDEFTRSVNRALDDLSIEAALDNAIPHVDGSTDSVASLDEAHSGIVEAGAAFYLHMSGRKSVRGDEAFAELGAEWERQKGNFGVQQYHANIASRAQSNAQISIGGVIWLDDEN